MKVNIKPYIKRPWNHKRVLIIVSVQLICSTFVVSKWCPRWEGIPDSVKLFNRENSKL